jgi:hypothetical protein
MKVTQNQIYHLHNHGNNNQIIFNNSKNYHLFLEMFKEYVSPFCEVLNWNLLPKEFNFIVKVNSSGAEIIKVGSIEMSRLADGIRKLQSQFAIKMNKELGRVGAFFKCKCKADSIKENFTQVIFDHIHETATNLGYVDQDKEWPFSSHTDYYEGRENNLVNFEVAKEVGIEIKSKKKVKQFIPSISELTQRIEIGILRGINFVRDHLQLHSNNITSSNLIQRE